MKFNIKLFYKYIFILLLISGLLFYIRNEKDSNNKYYFYLIDYQTLIYTYNHFYRDTLSFEKYLNILFKSGIRGVLTSYYKLSDILNFYNNIMLLREFQLPENLKNKIKKEYLNINYLYLIVPQKLNNCIEEIPDYTDKIKKDKYNIYIYKYNFFTLNSYKINIKIPQENLLKKYFKIIKLKHLRYPGNIDSFLVKKNNQYIIEKKIENKELIIKFHYFNKYGKEKFIDENYRAIIDRNVKGIYIRDIKDKNFEIVDFLPLIKKLNKRLEVMGYKIKDISFIPVSFNKISLYFLTFLYLFVYIFILYLLFSIFLFLWNNNFFSIRNGLLFILFILSSAFLISNILFNSLTYIDSSVIIGIKLFFLIPFLEFLIIIFKPYKNKIFSINITVKYFILINVLYILLLLIMIRSGNYNLFYTSLESKLRNSLLHIFLIRPRFKEMFFYAFLFLLFYESNFIKKNWIYFFLLSLPGIATTFNSFLHIHTPVMISLIRSIYGIIISFLFSLLLYIGIRFYEK